MMNNTFDIAKYPKTLGTDIVIKSANHIVDVFIGSRGWEQHARFTKRKTKEGVFLNQVSGIKVPKHIFYQVLEQVK